MAITSEEKELAYRAGYFGGSLYSISSTIFNNFSVEIKDNNIDLENMIINGLKNKNLDTPIIMDIVFLFVSWIQHEIEKSNLTRNQQLMFNKTLFEMTRESFVIGLEEEKQKDNFKLTFDKEYNTFRSFLSEIEFESKQFIDDLFNNFFIKEGYYFMKATDGQVNSRDLNPLMDKLIIKIRNTLVKLDSNSILQIKIN